MARQEDDEPGQPKPVIWVAAGEISKVRTRLREAEKHYAEWREQEENSGGPTEEPARFERGSGNVFADLGVPNPELALAKAALVRHIRNLTLVSLSERSGPARRDHRPAEWRER